MEKLSFLDAAFLHMESPQRPFHVAGLMLLKLPAGAGPGYLKRLAVHLGRLNELWPVFDKQLSEPADPGKAGWIHADHYDPARHVRHYALPPPGRMADLLRLVSAAHEAPLDRGRPLWELHLIEGLSGNRFAIYCKVHHALVDGVGALAMLQALFSTSPDEKIDFRRARPKAEREHRRQSAMRQLVTAGRGLWRHSTALPQVYRLLGQMGLNYLRGDREGMAPPFTAPRSIFNTELDSARRLTLCDLSLPQVRAISRKTGGTINDVLLAVCGGALRRYLQGIDQLPRQSLLAGMPVSLKARGESEGNQLCFLMAPYFTDEKDELKRLKKVIRTTRKAKGELTSVSRTASQDITNLLFVPVILLTLSGNTNRVNPAVNAIFSNVPGPRERVYLEGAELTGLYPLSVVTDGVGLNLTVVSYGSRLCFALTSCPTQLPGIEGLGELMKESFRELQAAVKAAT